MTHCGRSDGCRVIGLLGGFFAGVVRKKLRLNLSSEEGSTRSDDRISGAVVLVPAIAEMRRLKGHLALGWLIWDKGMLQREVSRACAVEVGNFE